MLLILLKTYSVRIVSIRVISNKYYHHSLLSTDSFLFSIHIFVELC